VLDGLNTLDPGTYRNERGLEAYYNLAVTPWLRVSGDIQWLQPFSSRENAVVAAVRTQIRF
jgi:porin